MLALGAAWAVSANSGNPEVRGGGGVRVQDPKGGMISKAFVVMHHEWDESANQRASRSTGAGRIDSHAV